MGNKVLLWQDFYFFLLIHFECKFHILLHDLHVSITITEERFGAMMMVAIFDCQSKATPQTCLCQFVIICGNNIAERKKFLVFIVF